MLFCLIIVQDVTNSQRLVVLFVLVARGVGHLQVILSEKLCGTVAEG